MFFPNAETLVKSIIKAKLSPKLWSQTFKVGLGISSAFVDLVVGGVAFYGNCTTAVWNML